MVGSTPTAITKKNRTMSLQSKYRFYIFAPSLGIPTEVFPSIDNLEFTLEKPDILRGLRRNVSSEIILKTAYFQILEDIRAAGTCEKVEIFIDTFCGSVWVQDFSGVINLRKCKWDERNCSVTLDIEINDIAKCLLDRKDVKVNLLDTPLGIPRIRAKGFEGFIEELTCPTQFFTSVLIDYNNRPQANACVPSGQGYVITRNFIDQIASVGTNLYTCEISSTYSRQRVNGGAMPLGGGWIALGPDWVRPVTTMDDRVNSFGDYQNPLNGNILDLKKVAGVVDGQVTRYDNGMLVFNVIDTLINLSGCPFVLVSDFFGWNPDGTNPNNIYYTNAANYKDLAVWQTSDVKRANAQNNAFVLNITLSELLNDLDTQFNLNFSVSTIGGINYFRIEHESYYTSSNGLDVSNYTDVEEAGKYEYLNDKRPRTEKWSFQQLTDNNGVFDYLPIEYDVNCSDAGVVIEYRADRTINNFVALQNNDNFPDNGITFAALILPAVAGGDYIIASDVELNDYMGFGKLIPFFHFFGRPFASGTIGGAFNAFVSSRVRREPVTIINKGHCFVHNWDTNLLIRTKLGWGEVENAEFNAGNCKISLSLLHN